MKKLFGIIAIAAIVAVAGWNFNQSQNEVELSDLTLTNAEALANPEGVHGAGGMANTKCPIWNIKYSESWSGPTIDCSTGGSYKCAEGTCPHGA